MQDVGTNRYAYAENDPVNKADNNGHQSVRNLPGYDRNKAPGVSLTVAAHLRAGGGGGLGSLPPGLY